MPADNQHIVRRSSEIVEKITHQGSQQVRLDHGHVLSYKYPAPRGYGVHGTLVGVYSPGVQPAQIADDLIFFIGGVNAAA